jgi:hypothetical protein
MRLDEADATRVTRAAMRHGPRRLRGDSAAVPARASELR